MADQAGELEVKLTADFESLKKGLSAAQETLQQFGKQGEKIGKNINSTFKKFGDNLAQARFVMAGIAGGFAAAGIASVVAAGKMEQWTVSFETMLGSADAAAKLLRQVQDFAAKTPFELPEVVQGSKNLLAFGIEADKLLPTLKSLGDVSAGLGVPMERLILNFGQVKAQAKLTGREVRDFAVAGVPIIAELSKNLNKSEADIQEMVSKGKIGFAEVEEAFRTMSGEGGRFANLMDKQSKTLNGVISNLKDNIIRLAISIGSELLPYVKAMANKLLEVTGFIQSMSPEIKRALMLISGMVAAVAGLAATIGFVVAFKATVGAFLAVVFGKIGLIIALIGTLVLGIVGVVTNFMGMRDAVVNSVKAIWNLVTTVATTLFSGLFSSLSALWDLLKTLFTGTSSVAASFFSDLQIVAGAVWDWFVDKIGKLIDWGSRFIPESWKMGYEAMKAATIETGHVIGGEFGRVASNIKNAMGGMKNAWGGTMDFMVEAQQAAINGMMVTVQTYNEWLAERTAEKMEEWMVQKQNEVLIDTAAKKAIGIQEGELWKAVGQMRDQAFDNFGSGMADMIMEGKRFSDVMKNIWEDLARQVIKTIAKMIAKWLAFLALRGVLTAFGGPGAGVAFGQVMGIAASGGAADGGLIREPSILTGLRSGRSILAGERGTEAIVPTGMGGGGSNVTAKEMGTSFAGGGDSVSVTVNIQGQFIEGNEAKWQKLIRDKIVPELRRRTMIDPQGLFNRRRGATT